MSRLVVVSAGTYHLPFDRLSIWMEEWLRDAVDTRVVMQHGPSRPVAGAENVEILPYAELLALCRRADAVVLQGGAGGVMDMRELGIVPIVVPRVPGGGEVVDDHQLVFTAEMEKFGILRRALTREQLAQQLQDTFAGVGTDLPQEIATPGAEVVRALLEQPVARLPWYERPRRLVRTGGAVARAVLRR